MDLNHWYFCQREVCYRYTKALYVFLLRWIVETGQLSKTPKVQNPSSSTGIRTPTKPGSKPSMLPLHHRTMLVTWVGFEPTHELGLSQPPLPFGLPSHSVRMERFELSKTQGLSLLTVTNLYKSHPHFIVPPMGFEPTKLLLLRQATLPICPQRYSG